MPFLWDAIYFGCYFCEVVFLKRGAPFLYDTCYLQTTFILGRGGLVSESLWGIAASECLIVYYFSLDFFVWLLWYFKANCDICLYFKVWLLNICNSGAVVFNMLATSNWCANLCFFYQHYQPGKATSQVSVLMIEYLVVVSFELWMV